jgi:hypothetical protein
MDRRNKYGSRGSVADTTVSGVYILEGVWRLGEAIVVEGVW